MTTQGAVITNGTVMLGVNAAGDLNYDCVGAEDSNCPDPSLTGQSVVGLRYVPFNSDAISPACLCEGWGAADADLGLSGGANQDKGGPFNLTVDSFTTTPSTALSMVTIFNPDIPDARMQVVQDYHPSVSTNVYEDTVTITNTGTSSFSDLRYRRVMDWDVEPTAFSEWVTNQGTSPQLLFDSDNGFASSDPLAGPSYIDSQAVCGNGYTGPCAFKDLGAGGEYPAVTSPDDHGALFDFGFGTLGVGQSVAFRIFYGATANETTALASLTAAGADVYSLGESNCPVESPDGGAATDCATEPANSGVVNGTPNTFLFGFGAPFVPGGASSEDHAAGFFDGVNTLTIATTRDTNGMFYSSLTIPGNSGISPGVVSIDEFASNQSPYAGLCGDKNCDAQVQVSGVPFGTTPANNPILVHWFYVRDRKQGSTIWVKGDAESVGTIVTNCIVKGIANPPKCVNSKRILRNGDRDIMLLWRNGGDPWGGKR